MNNFQTRLRPQLLWAAAVMLVTCIPYVVVWYPTPMGTVFPWVLFNSDDHGVYFAWMRQAADGKWLFRNLFTNDPQRGIYPHLYFLLLGKVSGWTGLSIPLTYHLARVATGIGVLLAVAALARRLTGDRLTGQCAFWLTAVSGGFGWIRWFDTEIQRGSVDVWQAEALTFPSLYTNGLFSVSLLLILGWILLALSAEASSFRIAVTAGLCGLVLGNIHSYDVIPLAAVAGVYCLCRWAWDRRLPARALGVWLVSGLVAAPSVLFMAWLYSTEPVFRARADTATLSPALWRYAMGYGLLLPLAAIGACRLRPRRDESEAVNAARLFMLAWAITVPICAYLPLAFQRKLIMGFHLPLAILAGAGVAGIAQWAAALRPRLSRFAPVAVATAIVLATTPSSVMFLVRDIRVAFRDGTTSTGVHPVYWPASVEAAAEAYAKDGGTLLYAFPLNAVMLPAWSGRPVLAGHWGETPHFTERVREGFQFFSGKWDSRTRADYLRRNGVSHVLEGPVEQGMAAPGRELKTEPFLEPVYAKASTKLYRVKPAAPVGEGSGLPPRTLLRETP